jgi:hypothetical protein
VNLVALGQEKLGQVRTILAGNARDQSALCHFGKESETSATNASHESRNNVRPEKVSSSPQPAWVACMVVRRTHGALDEITKLTELRAVFLPPLPAVAPVCQTGALDFSGRVGGRFDLCG